MLTELDILDNWFHGNSYTPSAYMCIFANWTSSPTYIWMQMKWRPFLLYYPSSQLLMIPMCWRLPCVGGYYLLNFHGTVTNITMISYKGMLKFPRRSVIYVIVLLFMLPKAWVWFRINWHVWTGWNKLIKLFFLFDPNALSESNALSLHGYTIITFHFAGSFFITLMWLL
jgi:hypothetical protein